MLIAGVDIDIRFGKAIKIAPYCDNRIIRNDICSTKQINFDDPIASRKILRKYANELMQTYMAAIYDLTTVNHDHLFASLLRLSPQLGNPTASSNRH